MAYFLHDERFSEAFVNRPHRVYGKRLLPFSLWSQLLLEHAQSPVLAGEGCTPADLMLAARLCSTPWNPSFMVPDLSPPSTLALVVSSVRYRFLDELAKFSMYLGDYLSSPKLWESTKGGQTQRDVDAIIEQATYLVKETNITWEQAWTMPIGVASWTSVVAQKLSGAEIQFYTPDDEAAYQKHCREREARFDTEAAAKASAEGISFDEARKQISDAYWAKYRKNSHGNQSSGNRP